MQDPPILNPGSPFDDESDKSADNPYAPSVDRIEDFAGTQEPFAAPQRLSAIFWLVCGLVILGFIGLMFIEIFQAFLGLLVTVGAATRVPLVRRKALRRDPERKLPHELLMLAASWGIVLIIGLSSIVTFVAICLPSGLLVSTVGSSIPDGSAIAFIFGGSALVALFAFAGFFYLSLRLPI